MRQNKKTLKDELASLVEASTESLRQSWQRLFRTMPAERLSRDIMIRAIAYQWQQTANRSLSPAIKRRLHSIAQGDLSTETQYPRISIKPGATLIRRWHGESHTVLVTDNGFNYADKHYASLSQIATEITGAHWSGPRFFGLTNHTRKDRNNGA